MNSIYYVGGRTDFSAQQSRKSILRSKKHSLVHQSAEKPQRSSSRSRKTEPKYSLMRIKSDQNKTKRYQFNRIFFKTNDQNKETLKDSMVVSSEKTKNKVTIKCQNKITFRKTQQPAQNAEKSLKNNIEKAKKFYEKISIPGRNSSRSVRKLQRRSPFHQRSEKSAKIKEQPKQQLSTGSLFDSGIRQMYQISKNNKIFFCSTCLFYMSTVQIRSHHLSCKKPKDRKDYLVCWKRLIELLGEYNRHKYSDKLFRLLQYMTEFQRISQITQNGIYSLELLRILSYQKQIEFEDIDKITLFRAIQVIGEKIQSHKIII